MFKCTRTSIEDPADHPRENHEKHGQKLQVATQNTSSFNMREILGRKATLDNHLQKNIHVIG